MYEVTIFNNRIPTKIHSKSRKLKSGKVVKGINAIDSFSLSLLPSNLGFNRIYDYQTLVNVFNTNKNRYEFHGRVLYSRPAMDSNGLITKEVMCESYLGFLCDSMQTYIEEQNWTVIGLLQHILDVHNSQVEDYKHFELGIVTVEDANDNVFVGIQRENSWKTIQEKLIDKLGGEITFRVENGINYLDYMPELGGTKTTEIALSKNMKSISKENDPSSYITRLIPLGVKLTKEITTTDINGNVTTDIVETEERLDITSVNGGLNYIEDTNALKKFGIKVGYVYFDDVTDATNLLAKGQEYLVNNNKVLVKYTITALDLSLLGLDIDDFDVYNYHPIKNKLLDIDDVSRIIKKNIDIVNSDVSSSIEVGDNFKTLSDLQVEQSNKLNIFESTIGKIESNYVTNEKLTNESTQLYSIIQQSMDNILLGIEENYVNKVDNEEFAETVATQLEIMSGEILAYFSTTTEQITEVNGELQSKFTELYKYISMSENGITIGSGDNAVTLQLDNEAGIIFYRNGVQFGSWDGENFYTGNIVIRVNERAQFGNFAYVPRTDGSLMFLKVGDSNGN